MRGVCRGSRRFIVAEVDVHRLLHPADLRDELVVRRLAAPEVPKRRGMVEVVDANRPGERESLFDPGPRRMLEVECEPERGVERSQQQLENAFVARVLQRHAHRPEPVAERVRALREFVEPAQPVTGELRRKLESVRHLLGPAPELILGRQAVARRVQLDGREAPA